MSLSLVLLVIFFLFPVVFLLLVVDIVFLSSSGTRTPTNRHGQAGMRVFGSVRWSCSSSVIFYLFADVILLVILFFRHTDRQGQAGVHKCPLGLFIFVLSSSSSGTGTYTSSSSSFVFFSDFLLLLLSFTVLLLLLPLLQAGTGTGTQVLPCLRRRLLLRRLLLRLRLLVWPQQLTSVTMLSYSIYFMAILPLQDFIYLYIHPCDYLLFDGYRLDGYVDVLGSPL